MSNFTEVPMPNLTALLDQYGIEFVDGIVMESKADHYAWNYNYNLLPSISSSTTSPTLTARPEL